MNLLYLGTLFCIIFIVFGGIFIITWKISNQSIDRRLLHLKKYSLESGVVQSQVKVNWRDRWMKDLVKLSMPKEKWESSPLRIHFWRAGYPHQETVFIYYGFKTILCIIFFLTAIIYCYLFRTEYDFTAKLFLGLICAGIGYYLPNLWISYRIKKRKERIFDTFPDALDLIRICVSSGLGLDAAIARVGSELSISSKALSEEFHQLNLELRAGATRENALKNLASRTGVDDIRSLATMLIQSMRFGTSVAESLKIHAEGLRSIRKLKAQEAAAKIPAKLSIPMILCIFPALFVVILGPSILRILQLIQPSVTN